MSTKVEMAFFGWNATTDGAGKYLSGEIPYLVFDVASEEAAITAVLAVAPETFNGLARKSIKFDEQLNENCSKVIVTYGGSIGQSGELDEGTPFSFDTTGGSQTITQSKSTMNRFPSEAPDYGGAINYDGEEVKGTEIPQPVLNFTETGYFKPNEITTSFRKVMFSMTGKINSKRWRGFEPGELLFRGVTGSGKTNLNSELTFHFSYSENVGKFNVGDIEITSGKKGWDFMWVRYADKIDSASKSLVKKPVAVYIEKVFDEADFSRLGIGH